MTDLNKKNRTLSAQGTNSEITNCPNCWGTSEYDGISYQQDVVNKIQKGWIQDYAEKKLF